MSFEARNLIVLAMSDFKHWAYAIGRMGQTELT